MPFVAQAGINYRLNSFVGFSVGYNVLDLEIDNVEAKLAMPAALVFIHPFEGSFFLQAGMGKESLDLSTFDSTSGVTIEAEADATTTILGLGWMWGAGNGGFWFGMDAAYIVPSGAKTSITAPGVPTNDPEYQDTKDALDKLADKPYVSLTFARFGWLF